MLSHSGRSCGFLLAGLGKLRGGRASAKLLPTPTDRYLGDLASCTCKRYTIERLSVFQTRLTWKLVDCRFVRAQITWFLELSHVCGPFTTSLWPFPVGFATHRQGYFVPLALQFSLALRTCTNSEVFPEYAIAETGFYAWSLLN